MCLNQLRLSLVCRLANRHVAICNRHRAPALAHDMDPRASSNTMAAKQIPKDIVDEFIERHPEFEFVSLQLGEGFLDSPSWIATADKIQTLDAVISVDSAIAHCAASVGVKTLDLIGDETIACWRWHPVGETTYWYDNMTTVWWDNYADWDTGLEKALSYLDKPVVKKRGRPKKSVV